VRVLHHAILLLLVVIIPGDALAARRLALLVGANEGWVQDRSLRHAENDARNLGRVLTELGDFPADSVVLLSEPTTEQLRAALDEAARQLVGSTEEAVFVFYYSGHADNQHLHLRGAPLSFEELYSRLRGLPARVKLGIFDACQSGSILAVKAGKSTAPFNVTMRAELTVQGTVILTSSGADELSQESNAISGSFFTHHLVSGLRGAADEDANLRVSLNEAYRYASARTLVDTAATPAGPQQPAFRTDLKGHSEFYLTRLEGPGPVAFLQFPRGWHRCFVTDIPERLLVAEILPHKEQDVQLVLPASQYLLKCKADETYRIAALDLRSGERLHVTELKFREAPLSGSVLKGGHGSLDPVEVFKRQGFAALKDGNPDQALRLFNRALERDRRDREAFRGKAQAYLAMAELSSMSSERERLRSAAINADPSIEAEPEFSRALGAPEARLPEVSPPVPAPPQAPMQYKPTPEERAIHQESQRTEYPRRYQRWGVGLALVDSTGIFVLSVERLLTTNVQVALSVGFPSLGARARYVLGEKDWGLFTGMGASYAFDKVEPPPPASSPDSSTMDLTRFERSLFVEFGVTSSYPRFQWDIGVAGIYASPRGSGSKLALSAILAFKGFPGCAEFSLLC
jgi:tetratricopeptide (TPR) repeat protein